MNQKRRVISREILFFTSLLGVFNGLFLTAYFLFAKKSARYANVYLGLMLLALVIRIGKSVFFHFDSGLNEWYIHIGLLGCMAIGPMCLYFAKSQISGNRTFDPRSLLHLIPLLGLSIFAIFFVSYDENRKLWSGQIVRGIYYFWGAYTLVAAGLVIRKRYWLKQRFEDDIWTQGVILGVFFIWLAYFTSSFTSYLTGAITFSFLVYLLAGLLINQLRKKPKGRSKTAKTQRLSQTEAGQIKQKLNRLMEREERYKDAQLTMPVLAKELGQTPHQFSQFINDHLNQNFAQFINSHRIGAAKDMLLNSPYLTVEAIGFDCGFNSPSTFHTTFKKATGMTPAAYRKQSLVSSDL